MSEDPIRDGLNWYTYTSGNPVRYKDPTGYWEEGDELLPSWAQATVRYYTDQWLLAEASGDRAGMDYAHQQATWVRNEVNAGRTPGRVLDVPRLNQLRLPYSENENNFCWASNALSIESYYKGNTFLERNEMTLERLVFTEDSGMRGTGAFAEEFADYVKYDSEIIGGQLSYAELQEEINNGNPVYIEIQWLNGGAHAVTVTGTMNINGVEGVLYNDPWGGVQKFVPYDELSGNGTFEANQGTWDDSVKTSRSNKLF